MDYTTRPPARLSDLITLAVADARSLDRDAYRPDAASWHLTGTRTAGAAARCRVCLAGCVIAGTLQAPPADIAMYDPTADDERVLTIEDAEWREALFSLNHARDGHWRDALCSRRRFVDDDTAKALGRIPCPKQTTFHDWAEFDDHLASLEDRAGRLRAIGL